MSEFEERINQLQQRLENLAKYQEDVHKEIVNIHFELKSLRASVQHTKAETKQAPPQPPVREYIPPPRTYQPEEEEQTTQPPPQTATPPSQTNYTEQSNDNRQSYYTAPPTEPEIFVKSSLERFIGENLISKIGIIITVLGVAIGAKYAIDRELISPLGRIILGYLFGFGLLAVATRLKDKYLNFSAVLLSGAMAIHYFITYAAYSFYGLISQSSAFALMFIFTIFTVAAAIRYNRQVIAHFGLVGAYTIPFLLSDGSGNYAFLFSYISIINIGILVICIKKYWKPLYYSSFIITWATFYVWFLFSYRTSEHFQLGLIFSTVFFFIFYITFLAYKIINKEPFTPEIVFLVLANSFIFYGFGYAALGNQTDGERFLGLFTVGNALIHFLIGFAISRSELADRSMVHLLTALFMTFITIAVPVQFRGSWVTLLWTAEAAFLFWIGRRRAISLYEYFSYPLMALASISLLNDWQRAAVKYYEVEFSRTPIFNSDFLTAILFVAAFAFIYFVNKTERYKPAINDSLLQIARYAIPTVLLIALYNTFRIEIGNYWHLRLAQTAVFDASNTFRSVNNDLYSFNIIWQINYSMFFLTVLSLTNIKKLKNPALGFINLGLNTLILLVFLVGGLYILGELRESFLLPANADAFNPGISHIIVRYISLAFVAALIYASYEYTKQEFLKEKFSDFNFKLIFDFVFYFSLLVIVSSELVNLMDIFGYGDSYKLGLSILWGCYAVFLIVLGINKNKKHLRIGAIVLFALTLVKLFFYDIRELNTISKTIVFVSLGILLLIISFLYNKYKHLIIEPNEV
jgi:uncharacterized membrane protein